VAIAPDTHFMDEECAMEWHTRVTSKQLDSLSMKRFQTLKLGIIDEDEAFSLFVSS